MNGMKILGVIASRTTEILKETAQVFYISFSKPKNSRFDQIQFSKSYCDSLYCPREVK